jgi:small subunit ribosomal protein S5
VAEEKEVTPSTPGPTSSGSDAPPAPPTRPPERQDRQGGGGDRRRRRHEPDQGDSRDEFVEKVIFINRSAKVVKGGRRFSFSALVVTGDRRGRVGIGLGKGSEVSDAIKKGGDNSKSAMVSVSLNKNTIPHEVYAHFGGAKVLLRPASAGTGLICGKTVRAVVESVGIRDVLTKSLGSKNAANVAKATLKALLQLRTRDQIYSNRGLEHRLNKAAA